MHSTIKACNQVPFLPTMLINKSKNGENSHEAIWVTLYFDTSLEQKPHKKYYRGFGIVLPIFFAGVPILSLKELPKSAGKIASVGFFSVNFTSQIWTFLCA